MSDFTGQCLETSTPTADDSAGAAAEEGQGGLEPPHFSQWGG